MSLCKVSDSHPPPPPIFTKFCIFRQIFVKVTDINFHEIRPVGAVPMHADGQIDGQIDRQTNRQTDMTNLTVAYIHAKRKNAHLQRCLTIYIFRRARKIAKSDY